MALLNSYLVTAILISAALVALAEISRTPDSSAGRDQALCAIAGGVIWPLLIVGALELGVLAMVRRGLAPGTHPHSQLPMT